MARNLSKDWGTLAVFGGAVPASLLMRMSEICAIYDKYRAYAIKLRQGSPLVQLMELQKAKAISDDDFFFIHDLIERGYFVTAPKESKPT